jgi:hypothetical protein
MLDECSVTQEIGKAPAKGHLNICLTSGLNACGAAVGSCGGISDGGYCAQPPRFCLDGGKASPPSSGCTVHAQGIKSWVGGIIRVGFCLGC